jgi:hypothetical protein
MRLEVVMKNKMRVKFCSVLTLCCFLFSVSPMPAVSEAAGGEADKNAVEYVIEDIQGSQVQVKEAGSSRWESAQEGQVLISGDEVKVGGGSEASLALENHTTVNLRSGSYLKVGQIEANESKGFISRLILKAGSVLADVKKNLTESHSTFEIESNGVVCGVRGTAFEVNVQGDIVQNITYEGKVVMAGGGQTHLVAAGNLFGFRGGRYQMKRALKAADVQKFKKWRNLRKLVMQKRLKRLKAIKNHKLKPWKRKHPHPALQKEIMKKKPQRMKQKRKK